MNFYQDIESERVNWIPRNVSQFLCGYNEEILEYCLIRTLLPGSYSSNTSWRKGTWGLKFLEGGGHGRDVSFVGLLGRGELCIKTLGTRFEICVMYGYFKNCEWFLWALSCKTDHKSFGERRWKFCWFVNLQHNMNLKTRWRQHWDGFTRLMAGTHGSWWFSGCSYGRNHTEQV